MNPLRQPYTLIGLAALVGAVISTAAALGLALRGSLDVQRFEAAVQAQIEIEQLASQADPPTRQGGRP